MSGGGAFLREYERERILKSRRRSLLWSTPWDLGWDPYPWREPLPTIPPDLFEPLPWEARLAHERVEFDGFEVPLFAEHEAQRERREWYEARAARGLRRRRDPRFMRGLGCPS
jgi:hypothetical protein